MKDTTESPHKITAGMTAGKLIEEIYRSAAAPAYRIRKLSPHEKRDLYVYVISLKKEKGRTLEERTAFFYDCLKRFVPSDYKIICSDKRFMVENKKVRFIFYLEAYRKNCDQIGYIESGEVRTELMHRISCENAMKWLERNCTVNEKNCILQALDNEDITYHLAVLSEEIRKMKEHKKI